MNNLINSNDEIDFRYIITRLYYFRFQLIQSSIVLGILFVIISLFQPKMYKSNISFFKINDTNNLSLSVDTILGNDGGINDKLDVDITDIISSKKLSIEVVNHQWTSINNNLISFWGFDKEGIISKFFSSNGTSDFKTLVSEEAAVKEFISKRISINEDLKTGLITVYLETEDRELSVEILNFIKDFVLDFSSSNITQLSEKEVEYLYTRVDSVNDELKQIEQDMINFLDNNKNYLDSPELTIFYQKLVQDRMFTENVMITLLQQVEIAKLNQIKISPVIETLDSPKKAAKKSSPKRIYWLLSGLSLGFILSVLNLIYRRKI